MNLRFGTLHNMSRGRCFSVSVLVAMAIAAAGPGEVITVSAICDYQSPGGDSGSSAAERNMVLISPACSSTPVFLAQGWQRTVTRKDGTTYTYYDLTAAGMLVRSFVWLDGQVRLADGIMTRDGRVCVGGRLLERADGPQAARDYLESGGG